MVPGTGCVGDHRHGRDRRETGDPVGTPAFDDVGVGGGHHLDGLVPVRPDETALAAGPFVGARFLLVLDDGGPRQHGITVLGLGLPVHLQQDAPDVGVAHPGRGVGVPGERCSARAAAGFVLGPVGTDGGVVGLLRLPGDDPVLDVDLPGARPGAVHPVGGANHLVVGPAVPVEGVAATALLVDGAPVTGDLTPREEPAGVNQQIRERTVHAHLVRVGHCFSPSCPVSRLSLRQQGPPEKSEFSSTPVSGSPSTPRAPRISPR